jgi:hypothetical protein
MGNRIKNILKDNNNNHLLYRGAKIPLDIIKKDQENSGKGQGRFLIFQEFLSATYSEKIAIGFTKSGILKEGCKRVLYRIQVNENEIRSDKVTPFNAINLSQVYTSVRFRSYEKPSNLVFQFLLCDYDHQFGLLNKEKPVAIGYYKVNRSLLENDLIEVDLSLINADCAIASLKSRIEFRKFMQIFF